MTSASPSTIPLRAADGVMACELGDGLAILHETSGAFYLFGEVESFIWRRLGTPMSADGLVRAVEDAFDAPLGQVQRDVALFIEEMVEASLVLPDAAHGS